ncbi:MAG: hypothetical protein NTU88_09065, partial [Armatimonadetes bacterium]|nr:hypothetical protein [Armatimonadota bacterium]
PARAGKAGQTTARADRRLAASGHGRRLVALWQHFNLHQLAWRPIPEEQPATLEYFMGDYVGHLKHHLAQVLGSA